MTASRLRREKTNLKRNLKSESRLTPARVTFDHSSLIERQDHPPVSLDTLNEGVIVIYRSVSRLNRMSESYHNDMLIESISSARMSSFLLEAEGNEKVFKSIEEARDAAVQELEKLDSSRAALNSTVLDVAIKDLRGKLATVSMDPASVDKLGGLSTFLGKTTKQLTFIANSIWSLNSTVKGIAKSIQDMFTILKIDPENEQIKGETLRTLASKKQLEGIPSDDVLIDKLAKKAGDTVKSSMSKAFSFVKSLFTGVDPIEFKPREFVEELIDLKISDLFKWINESTKISVTDNPTETKSAREISDIAPAAPESARSEIVTPNGSSRSGASSQAPKNPTRQIPPPKASDKSAAVPMGKTIFDAIDGLLGTFDAVGEDQKKVDDAKGRLKDLMSARTGRISDQFAETLGTELADFWQQWSKDIKISGDKISTSQSAKVTRQIQNIVRDRVKNSIKFESARFPSRERPNNTPSRSVDIISESRWAQLAGIEDKE